MKSKSATVAVLALVCLLSGRGVVSAQYSPYSPYLPPQNNAYLNLLRGGATPGQNYFSLTQPQINYAGGINTLQQQTLVNQQLITGLQGAGGMGSTGPVTTGQQFGFLNHLRYFQNQLTAGNQQGGFGFGAGPGGPGAGVNPGLGGGGITAPPGGVGP
jgi:hypothetical protein